MGTYEIGEEALKQILINTEALGLNEDTCGIDFDTVMHALVKEGNTNGCLLTFSGGNRASSEPLQGPVNRGRIWKWRIYCVQFLRYAGSGPEIEKEIRTTIDAVKAILDGDNMRLSGTVSYAEVISVDGPPEDVTINDMPFYLLGFTVEFWDKT